jgi:hypothetical protein
MKNKIIKLIAMTPTYRKDGLRVVAIPYMNTYITGQQKLPGDPSTEDGLTLNQMLGIDPLTVEQREKYPMVINPTQYYKFNHNHRFNLDNPEDEQLLNFLIAVERGIASSKKQFMKGKHTHYLEDQQLEAKEEITEFDSQYEAMKHIKSASFEVVQDVARYLTYSKKDFKVNIKSVSKDELYASLYKVCKETPHVIISCFTKDIKDEMLIMKMIDAGVVVVRNGEFYEGNDFLGTSMNAVVEFMRKKENASRLSKWNNFANQNGKAGFSDDEKAAEFLKSMKEAIDAKDVDLAKSINATLDKMSLTGALDDKFLLLKTDLAELFTSLKEENEQKAKDELEKARKEAEEKYSTMKLEELQQTCRDSKRAKKDWEGLDKKDLVDYLVQFVKVK